MMERVTGPRQRNLQEVVGLTAGWATPAARDWRDGKASEKTMERNSSPLNEQAMQFACYPTPNTMGGGQTSRGGDRIGEPLLGGVAHLIAGYPTPVANDDNKTPEAHLAMKQRMGERDGTHANRTEITSLQVLSKAIGAALGSSASTGAIGVLNPELPRWLMGYPAEWLTCAPGYQEWAILQAACEQQGPTAQEP
jgi:hypothetical protein